MRLPFTASIFRYAPHLMSVCAVFAAEPIVEQPVGLILAAGGNVFIDVHRTETPHTAAAGMVLFTGDTIRNQGGTVRFSFCPKSQSWQLGSGQEATMGADRIDAAPRALEPAPAPAFCDLPRL